MRKQARQIDACQTLTRWFMRELPSLAIQTVDHAGIALGTSTGAVREENQDRIAVARFCSEDSHGSFMLLAVCDGMGGMEKGGACASVALANLIIALTNNSSPKMSQRLAAATQEANYEVHRQYGGRGGSTCACVMINFRGEAIGMHVGDSRIYEYKPGRKLVNPLTVDHNIGNQVNQLLNDKNVRDDEPTIFSRQITQFVGQGRDLEPAFKIPLDILNRQVLITSDGAHILPVETFTQVISNAQRPSEAVRRVLAVANWCGGHDNASIICAHSFDILDNHEDFDQPGCVEVWDAFGKFSFVLPPLISAKPSPKRADNKQTMNLPLEMMGQTLEKAGIKALKKKPTRRAKRSVAASTHTPRPISKIELINNE